MMKITEVTTGNHSVSLRSSLCSKFSSYPLLFVQNNNIFSIKDILFFEANQLIECHLPEDSYQVA